MTAKVKPEVMNKVKKFMLQMTKKPTQKQKNVLAEALLRK